MSGAIGADKRIDHHAAPSGAQHASALARTPRVVIVGAGIAGLSAAAGLAERGVRVDIAERENYLGGRVGSWTTHLGDGEPISMSRGFHAFFRQYYNLRQLLRRSDPDLRRLIALDDYPLIDGRGTRESFRGLPRTPPWNAIAFALRSPTFRWRDFLALDTREAAPLANVSVPAIYRQLDNTDADTFLRRINFPEAARHLAFEVFSRSFFAQPEELSAAELATMFHIYFLGSSEGLIFDVPDASFGDSLWNPLHDYLVEHDVTFRSGTSVDRVDVLQGGRFRVYEHGGEFLEADGVVLATDVAGLRAIVENSSQLGDTSWRTSVRNLRTAPPFLVQRLWLDRPVAAHRPPFLGTSGHEPLDNVSVLNRYERQARDWASRRQGAVVELHAYSASADADVDELRQQLLRRLHEIYPETAHSVILGEQLEWRADCPLFGVGDFARRPTVTTPNPGLVLAGDGIRIDMPVALMERAATTGWHAANCLLTRWGLAGHPLFSVPTKGRVAALAGLTKGETG